MHRENIDAFSSFLESVADVSTLGYKFLEILTLVIQKHVWTLGGPVSKAVAHRLYCMFRLWVVLPVAMKVVFMTSAS